MADAYRQQLVLWVAMAISIPVYFVVARMVQPVDVQANETLVAVLLVVALSLVGLSFPMKSRLRKQSGLIVALILCEAAALFGLVIRFATGSPYYYVFLALGFAGVLLHFPRRQS